VHFVHALSKHSAGQRERVRRKSVGCAADFQPVLFWIKLVLFWIKLTRKHGQLKIKVHDENGAANATATLARRRRAVSLNSAYH